VLAKTSIHASDYFEPLTFEFDTQVLQASVLETTPPTLINPSTLHIFLTLTPQSVQFPSFPLNPGDTVQISILLEGKGTLKVRGRLDQGTVEKLEPPEKLLSVLVIPAAIAMGAGSIAVAAAITVTTVTSGAIATEIIGAAIAIVATATVAIGAVLERVHKKANQTVIAVIASQPLTASLGCV